MLFSKTLSTMGKTGKYEGVKRKRKGLPVSFDMEYVQCKPIVRPNHDIRQQSIKGALQDQPFSSSIYRLPAYPTHLVQ